jgi:hypothetical protein
MVVKGSAMIAAHIKALSAMKGKSVEAGWFESARYSASEESDAAGEGIQMARVARMLEYGGVIDHPGGTKYIKDAATSERFLGTRFVKSTFTGDHEVTKPHKIVIPARPFMRLAWANFYADRSKIQKRIARDLISGKISIDKALAQIGDILEGYIAKAMVNGGWQKNAVSTIRKKGFDKPLIHHSHLLQGIESQVTNQGA